MKLVEEVWLNVSDICSSSASITNSKISEWSQSWEVRRSRSEGGSGPSEECLSPCGDDGTNVLETNCKY